MVALQEAAKPTHHEVACSRSRERVGRNRLGFRRGAAYPPGPAASPCCLSLSFFQKPNLAASAPEHVVPHADDRN